MGDRDGDPLIVMGDRDGDTPGFQIQIVMGKDRDGDTPIDRDGDTPGFQIRRFAAASASTH